MPTITFFGHSDDLLEAEFPRSEVEAVGVVDEMDCSVGGWVVTYPDGGGSFAVVGAYTDRGHWRISFDFAPGVDEEGEGVSTPSHIDAAVGQKRGTPYSGFLDVVVPVGTRLEPLTDA